MNNLTEKIQAISQQYDAFQWKNRPGEAWRLSTTISDLEADLRESIQLQTQSEINQVIDKLRMKQLLDVKDIEYLKLWIVGDADYYSRLENNYQDWIIELERLMKEVKQINQSSTDLTSFGKARALLLDAMRVLGDIVFYLQQKERVQNFDSSTQEIDDGEREILISLLEGKSRSSKM